MTQLTNYPELKERNEHESEFRVHFTIRNISTFFSKMDLYKLIYDTLISFGEVKEISFQKVDNDSCCFVVGMKKDDVAEDIIENKKLLTIMDSFKRGEKKPYLEVSLSFQLYLNFLKEKRTSGPKKDEIFIESQALEKGAEAPKVKDNEREPIHKDKKDLEKERLIISLYKHIYF